MPWTRALVLALLAAASPAAGRAGALNVLYGSAGGTKY
jgi:hypothetical protein